MKTGIIIVYLCLASFFFISCDNKEDVYIPKGYERELNFDSHRVDSIITINEFTSGISKINYSIRWLSAQKYSNNPSEPYGVKISCSSNTTSMTRSANIIVYSDNKDSLIIRIIQKEMINVNNEISNNPPLAPARLP